MNPTCERITTVLGRLLLGLIFLMSGIGKAFDAQNTEGYMKAAMTPLGIPERAIPALRIVAIVFEVLGAVLVIAGLWTRLGAILLMMFLLAATPIFHPFWSVPKEQFQMQMINFMKNLSIFGGLLIVLARGGGLCSFDNLWRSKVQSAPAEHERK
jgi:putative oxidoreductase